MTLEPHFSPDVSLGAAPRAGRDHLAGYYRLHVLGALLPLIAGVGFYGWRVLEVLTFVVASAVLGVLIWRRIGSRGATLRWSHVIWMALLLCLMLPPHLLQGTLRGVRSPGSATWPMLPAAALLLVMIIWVVGGAGLARVHPVILAYLLLAMLCREAFTPHLVLHRASLFVGDLVDVDPSAVPAGSTEEPWIFLRDKPQHDAIHLGSSASQRLSQYTRLRPAQRAPMPMEAMLRDHMPPLEDLVVGGHPGPIGSSSAIAAIIGGLFLLYWRLIDYRVPLIIVIIAFVGFAVVPAMLMHGAYLDWANSITFANYEIMASPLVLMAFFLASDGTICPLGRRARTVYAALVGVVTVFCQLYVSVAYGPYIALGVVAVFSSRLQERFPEKLSPT